MVGKIPSLMILECFTWRLGKLTKNVPRRSKKNTERERRKNVHEKNDQKIFAKNIYKCK